MYICIYIYTRASLSRDILCKHDAEGPLTRVFPLAEWFRSDAGSRNLTISTRGRGEEKLHLCRVVKNSRDLEYIYFFFSRWVVVLFWNNSLAWDSQITVLEPVRNEGVENSLSWNCNIFLVLSIIYWNIIQKAKQMINLLLFNNFYLVISYWQIQKENYRRVIVLTVRSLVMVRESVQGVKGILLELSILKRISKRCYIGWAKNHFLLIGK